MKLSNCERANRANRAAKKTVEWSLLSSFCSHVVQHCYSEEELLLMPTSIQVGTILIKEWPGMPQLIGFETESGFGEWRMVKVQDAYTFDRKIQAAGWNLFFMASEVKAMFLGSLGAAKIQSALQRIVAKVKAQNFNGLEVTAIVARHFLGIPYVTLSAHSRHMQHSCHLDSAEARQTSQENWEWARG